MVGKILSISATCVILLTGCGGSGSSDESDDQSELTGVFVDSAVGGITYSTATQSGTTNSAGEFNYVNGEEVTFSIGAMELPTVDAASQISPVDMGATSSDPATTTTNIARLLQSLDQDGNPDNGITIPSQAAASAASINFDVSNEEFENDPAVINLVANSGSVNTSLISAEEANAHLDATLNATSRPEITDFSLTGGAMPVLTVRFSTDMTTEFKTEGEYVPARSFWQDLRTFVVEFESVQPGGSIRLIPEFFISVTGETLAEGLEVTFTDEQSGGNNNQGEPRTITTSSDFTETIVGKQLVFRNEDGTRNEGTQAVINASGKVVGFSQSGDWDIDWYWEDQYYCRSGVTGLPDNSTTLELDCQAIDVNAGIVTFTRNQGAGDTASYFIE